MRLTDFGMPRKLRNFLRTPKGLLLIALAILAAVAAPHEGIRKVITGMGAAMLIAGAVDVLILRARRRTWEFPSGAILTAMIVAMVLRAQEPWYVIAITSVAAV